MRGGGTITYRPLNVFCTACADPVGAAVQGAAVQETTGRIELLPEYAAGLRDLDAFSPRSSAIIPTG